MAGQVRNRFVALFDIVGFKALRSHLGTAGLYDRLAKSTIIFAQHAAAGRGKTVQGPKGQIFVPDFHPDSMECRIVSDTIILIAKDDSFGAFLNIVHSCCSLLQYAIGAKTPIRGAIGHGDAILDGPNILLGEAVEDAQAYEAAQVWAGCCLTERCENYARTVGFLERRRQTLRAAIQNEPDGLRKRRWQTDARRLVTYQLPLQTKSKTGPVTYSKREALVIDWTLTMAPSLTEAAFIPSDDPHAQLIVKNTIEFDQWARARVTEDAF